MMLISALKKISVIVFTALMSTYSYAEAKAIEFSAEAVITVPRQPVREMKLFVGGKAVRREMSVNGQNFIEIVSTDGGRSLLINEDMKSYRETMYSVQNDMKESNTPCDQIANSVCEKLGEEVIDGYTTEKWQIISNSRGGKLRTLHWIDVKRKLAIREFFPDGSVAELKMLGKEKINGRNTEKWQRTMSRPDGQSVKSFQWYDTGLKIAIREELPGGYVRELKNIKISSQSGKLFSVPEGYTKIEDRNAVPAANPVTRWQ